MRMVKVILPILIWTFQKSDENKDHQFAPHITIEDTDKNNDEENDKVRTVVPKTWSPERRVFETLQKTMTEKN